MVARGGCEVALHTTARMTAGETYAGLVEAGVGLIPAGGGTKELALRAYEMMSLTERGDPMAFLQRAFLLIGMGRTSGSGHEAVEIRPLSEPDVEFRRVFHAKIGGYRVAGKSGR